MTQNKIVLTGIARSKGKAAGEAMVNRQRMGWAFNHVGNEDGIVLVPGADIQGKSIIGKVVVYPTVMGSTTGAISLYYKCKQSHHGPAAIICQKVHAIDISGAIAGEIPAVDSLDQDPITTIKTGDWVEIDAPKVGQKATVTITRKVVRSNDIGNAIHRRITMAMKLTTLPTRDARRQAWRNQEVRHGEAGGLRRSGRGQGNGGPRPCPQLLSHLLEGSPESRDEEETRDVRSGTRPALRSDLRDEGRPRRGRNGHPRRKRSVPGAVRQGRREGLPWNFELPGKGSFKIDDEMVAGLKAGRDKLAEHGWLNWFSCQPQVNTCIPKMGEYCASSESSCAAYINTIIGARTNRESPINTVYAAYTGCLPKYGTHLDENRAAKCIVELDDETRDNMVGAGDWAALGAAIAEKAENRIPAVLNLPKKLGPTAAKQIVSACSPGMNDPMMHLMGYTPESPTLEAAFKGKMPKNPERFTVTMDDIVEMFRHINAIAPAPGPERAKPVDIVIFGCPVATFEEVREVARLLKGKKVKEGVMLWVQTDTPNYHMAHHYGDAKIIEEAGGKIYHQTCMAMNPVRHYPQGITIATDSFKYVKLGGGFGMAWIFGNPPALVNAAVTGVFTPTARWDYWAKPRKERLASEKERPLYSKPRSVRCEDAGVASEWAGSSQEHGERS